MLRTSLIHCCPLRLLDGLLPNRQLGWLPLVAVVAVVLFAVSSSRLIAEELETSDVVDRKFYDPEVMSLEGWTIKVDPKLLLDEHREEREQAFAALANHLQRIAFIMPSDKLKQVRDLPIWIELNNERIGGMQYHPGRGWLEQNGYDPRLVKHVHIPKASELSNPKTWAKHPYVVLHELAHAYHDQVLDFDNEQIAATFEAAKADGRYENVLLYTGKTVRHYGLSNPKEYFAEATEAYFGVNDFYPFVRAELREHDPRMYQLLESIWGPVAE